MILRIIVALYASGVLISAQVSPPQPAGAAPDRSKEKCRVEGRVVSLATGQAIRKAQVRLQMQPSQVGLSAGEVSIYTSTSDSEGKFVFEDIEPGRYGLSAERSGFVSQTFGARSPAASGTPLNLSPGEQMSDLVFKLIAQGLIQGKVGDEDGDPLNGGFVQMYRYGYSRGRRMLQQINTWNVNVDGSFMIGNLAPGRYFLSASAKLPMSGFGLRERPGHRAPEEEYATTYYPNALEPSAAAPIDVSAGSEIRGIEIRLRKTQLFHIRGKVLGVAPAQTVALGLTPKDASSGIVAFRPIMSFAHAPEGAFEFNYVRPGTYLIQTNPNLRLNGEKVAPGFARVEVTVSGQNVDDLVVPLIAGQEISGSIKIDGVDRSPQSNIVLTVTEGRYGNAPQTQSKDDGTFLLTGIAPDKYRVNVFSLPDGTYVKSIRFGGQEVSRTGLDLTSGSGGKLDILLTAHSADVSGIVRDADGGAVTGVMVSLWSPGPDPSKSATTDQNGAFKIRNLAPGEYCIVAWEDVELGLAQDPDFRKLFESQATSLTLHEDSHENTDVKLIPKDVIEAEAAKLR